MSTRLEASGPMASTVKVSSSTFDITVQCIWITVIHHYWLIRIRQSGIWMVSTFHHLRLAWNLNVSGKETLKFKIFCLVWKSMRIHQLILPSNTELLLIVEQASLASRASVRPAACEKHVPSSIERWTLFLRSLKMDLGSNFKVQVLVWLRTKLHLAP